MGGQTSNPAKQEKPQKIVTEEDHFVLQKLENISLRNKSSCVYFWVDPKIYNSQNAKYERYLNKYLQIEGLSSVEGLQNKISTYPQNQIFKVICAASLEDEDYRRLCAHLKIKTLFLFCQNQERARLLMNNFPKILFAKFDITQLKNAILQLQDQDDASDSKSNILFLIEEDAYSLNQYRINFHSLTCKHSQHKAKKDFMKLVSHLYPEQKASIAEFQQNYRVQLPSEQRAIQVTKYAMKKGFYWDVLQSIPRITTNPKILAYLRYPFRQLYDGIKESYQRKSGEAYMVLIPSDDQLMKLQENVKNFIIFTSFAKAYTNEKIAYQQYKKTPGSYFVRIILPLLHKGNSIESLDFGYYIDNDEKQEPNIIFNIYNFFLIEDFEQSLKEITLSYGSLSQVSYKREHRRNTYRLSPFEQNLMRNYDYLDDLTSNINSQATVLQMSGFFKQSLEVHQKKFQEIRKSQSGQQVLDKQTIELGDAYKRDEQFQIAEKHYRSVLDGKHHFRALVHLADLYLASKDQKKLDKIINSIQDSIESKQHKDPVQVFRARNYIGLQLIEGGKYLEASKLYKLLLNDISQFYDYKYEGIPLVHEIYTNRATCETKLNNYPEALNLLDTTKNWQKICEGTKSKNLQKTESLIKSVRISRGETLQQFEKEKVKSQKIRTKKKQSIEEPCNFNTNVDQSDVNVLLNTPEPPQKINNKKTNLPPMKPIEQSNINIDTSGDNHHVTQKPKKILEQSAFGIIDL